MLLDARRVVVVPSSSLRTPTFHLIHVLSLSYKPQQPVIIASRTLSSMVRSLHKATRRRGAGRGATVSQVSTPNQDPNNHTGNDDDDDDDASPPRRAFEPHCAKLHDPSDETAAELRRE